MPGLEDTGGQAPRYATPSIFRAQSIAMLVILAIPVVPILICVQMNWRQFDTVTCLALILVVGLYYLGIDWIAGRIEEAYRHYVTPSPGGEEYILTRDAPDPDRQGFVAGLVTGVPLMVVALLVLVLAMLLL